jgi:hypothetical protein
MSPHRNQRRDNIVDDVSTLSGIQVHHYSTDSLSGVPIVLTVVDFNPLWFITLKV